jgi:phosphoglycerol transferase MdoB-like AlkP superfamily enzyme
MAKKQKIWLAVFLAMFLVPEILWPQSTIILYSWIREVFFGISPVAGEFSRFSIFSFNQLPQLSNALFLLKMFGLVSAFIYSLILFSKSKNVKILIINIIIALLLLVNLFYILFLINFNPRIG